MPTWPGTGPFFGQLVYLAAKTPPENIDVSPSPWPGAGPFFGQLMYLAAKTPPENMDLSPSSVRGLWRKAGHQRRIIRVRPAVGRRPLTSIGECLPMFGIGHFELMVVCVIALLLFGNRLPSVMRSLGSGITEFKKGLHDVESTPVPAKKPDHE
jgi:sec-independent protein translocase protein TatA